MGVLENVAIGVGVIGVVVVGWGVLISALIFVREESKKLLGRNPGEVPLEKIRYNLGRHLLLGLEFLIAADVMRTIAQPSLEQVTVLAIIVAIRTVLSFFLTRDIERVVK
jgi:uncharacterized membrane protein